MRRTALSLIVALSAGCAGARTEPATPQPRDVRVDGATAVDLVKRGALVLDVRTPQEFASGHVPGAVNVPYDEVERRLAEIGPPGREIVVYCRTGRRSSIAAQSLERLGYGKVYDLGPIGAWPGELAPPAPAAQAPASQAPAPAAPPAPPPRSQ